MSSTYSHCRCSVTSITLAVPSRSRSPQARCAPSRLGLSPAWRWRLMPYFPRQPLPNAGPQLTSPCALPVLELIPVSQPPVAGLPPLPHALWGQALYGQRQACAFPAPGVSAALGSFVQWTNEWMYCFFDYEANSCQLLCSSLAGSEVT